MDRHAAEYWTGIMLESWTGFAGMRRGFSELWDSCASVQVTWASIEAQAICN